MINLNFSSKNSSSHLLRHEKSSKSINMNLLLLDDKSKDSILYILIDLFKSKKYKYLYNYIVQIENIEKDLDITTFNFLFVTKLICINKILNQFVIKFQQNKSLLQREYSNAYKTRITSKQNELEIQINKTIKKANKLYKSCINDKNTSLNNLNHTNKEIIIQNFCKYLYINSNYFLLKNYINEAIATLSMSDHLFKYIIDISENEITCSLYEQILIKLIYFLISDNSYKFAIEKCINCLSVCMKEMKIRTQNFNNILVFKEKLTNEYEYILKIIYNIIITFYYLGVSYENLEYFFEAFDSYNQAKFFAKLIRNYFISENLYNFFSNVFNLSATYYKEIIGKHSKININKRRSSTINNLSSINTKPNVKKRVSSLFEDRKRSFDKILEKVNLNVEKINNSKLINHSDIITIHSKSKKKLKYQDITNNITIYNDLLSKNYWPFIKGISKINFNNIDYESSNKLERFNNQLLRDDKTNQEIEKENEEKNKKHDRRNVFKSKSLTLPSKNPLRNTINIFKKPLNELNISEVNNEDECENKENDSQNKFRFSFFRPLIKNNLFSKISSEYECSNKSSIIDNNISNNAANGCDNTSFIGNKPNTNNLMIGNSNNKSSSISAFANSLRKEMQPSPTFDMSSYKTSHKNLSINCSNTNNFNCTLKQPLSFNGYGYNQIKIHNYLNKSLSYIKKYNSIKKFKDRERYIFSKKFKNKKSILEKINENEINFQKKILNMKRSDSQLANKLISEQCNKNLNKNYQEEASIMYKKIMNNLSNNENNQENKKKKRVYSVEYESKAKRIKNNLIHTLVSSLDTKVIKKIHEFEQISKNKNNQTILNRLKNKKTSNISTVNDEKCNDDNFIFNQSQNDKVIEIINDKIRKMEEINIYYNKLHKNTKKKI